MRGAKLEGAGTSDLASPLFSIARPSCEVGSADRDLSQLAKGHLVSRAAIHRVLRRRAQNQPGEVCMTENTVAILLYMLMASAFGFMVGWTWCHGEAGSAAVNMQRIESRNSRSNWISSVQLLLCPIVSSKSCAVF